MHKIDYVLATAEAVVESGGIVSQIGTYQSALVAKAFSKPFYVVAESYQFVRKFPLDQRGIDNDFKYINPPEFESEDKDSSMEVCNASLDYTPP
eukprot:CAMPEP_0117427434 /NCGR_PEP_ID=MMETSP0758-20121206/7284_1 /TAXON_ID=63605 /ORGANISM="Percolomonas cosmopolitus, Strain AE-1 (ATCC 50343)" /LENGTH=93 /DNA_ID=CAMNT_0005213071 /DNA_START=570 /DNA_END=848 /DNA_ORIENTATION=-